MVKERYGKVSDLPTELAVFPLRGTILLPRTVLPLNIFEPRYLQMLDDILAGNRLIGMVQPAPGLPDENQDEEPDSPEDRTWPLRPVGCVGRLTAFSEQDDGHIFITLTGISRFRIIDETDVSQPYRICKIDAEPFATDLIDQHGADGIDRERVISLLQAFLDANEMTADWDGIKETSTEFLINALCIHSPFGPEEKQALLEAESLDARAEILMALAEMDLVSSSSEGGSTLQ